MILLYVHIGMDVWVNMTQKRKEAPAVRRETTRALSRPLLEGSGGASKVKHVQQISAPIGGPHLDRERLRLRTWSKVDFSIADTTWPTYLHIIDKICLRSGTWSMKAKKTERGRFLYTYTYIYEVWLQIVRSGLSNQLQLCAARGALAKNLNYS